MVSCPFPELLAFLLPLKPSHKGLPRLRPSKKTGSFLFGDAPKFAFPAQAQGQACSVSKPRLTTSAAAPKRWISPRAVLETDGSTVCSPSKTKRRCRFVFSRKTPQNGVRVFLFSFNQKPAKKGGTSQKTRVRFLVWEFQKVKLLRFSIAAQGGKIFMGPAAQ